MAFNLKLGVENIRSNDTQETRPRNYTDADDEDRWEGPKINLGLEMFSMSKNHAIQKDESEGRSVEVIDVDAKPATVISTDVVILPDEAPVETRTTAGSTIEMEKVKNIRRSLADDD